ncbi:MAG: TonB-dependent siderophore receptor [Burkholderiales bacterium]|nr:TonB-dependent siderophore receptor [Burkholderiales bacterium]
MSVQPNKRFFQIKPIAAAMLCAGCGSLILPVHAQQPAAGSEVTLPSVKVQASPVVNQSSSPKATAPLLDTPQTVNVIPQEVFRAQGANSLTEVLRNTPGISFNGGENGFATSTNNFSLRGFDSSANIFIDGVRDSGNYRRDVFNLEQVEVIKGPAADNGRGGAGGYINLVTKSPKQENFVAGSVSYGWDRHDSGARKRASVDINRKLDLEGAAFRLNLLLEDSGIAGRQHAEQGTRGFAPSLAFGLGTPTSLVFSYQHIRQDDRPDWGVPAQMIGGMFRFDARASTASRSNYYGLFSDFDDVTSDSFLAKIEHKLSPSMKVSNQTRWSKTDRSALYTLPTGYAPATSLVTTQRQAYSRENTTLSNQTNLSAAFDAMGVRHTLATGLELSRETSDAGRYPTNARLGNPGTTNIFNPAPGRNLAGFTGMVPTQTASVEIDTVALYAYDTIEFSKQWQATGGIRLERYSASIESRTAAGAPQGPNGYDRSETSVNGKVGVVYKPRDNGSIYASYGTSTLPPGAFLSNPDISREGDNAFPGWQGQNHRASKEQRLVNYELGTKWDLSDNQLSVAAAVFRTERKNVAMGPAAVAPVGYGEQSVQGVELGVSGAITRAWSVFGGLVLLDSKRKHSAAVDAALSGDYTNGATTTSGDELAFTPRKTANLWTTYRLPFGLTLGGGMQYVDSSYVGRPDTADRVIPNGQVGKLPGYTVFNLMAAYEVNRNLTLRLNLDNVTDKLYAVSTNWSAQRVQLGAPRTLLLSADMKF